MTVLYPEPFWRPAGLTGHALSLRGPLAVADGSSPAGRRGVLVGVLEGVAPVASATDPPTRACPAELRNEITSEWGQRRSSMSW
jgi:hypothetical protein